MKRRRTKLLQSLLFIVIAIAIIFGGYQIIMRQLYPMEYEELVLQYSRENNLDPALVFAVIKCESGFDPDAVSAVEAKGLMQMTDATFAWVQTKMPENENLPPEDLFIPEINIQYGTKLLRLHLDEFQSIELTLAAYHAGRGRVNEWIAEGGEQADHLNYIQFEETEHYVQKVIGTQEIYQSLYKGKF